MATKNGIKRAISAPSQERTAAPASSIEKGFNTKALTIANQHPTPREESLVWRCAGDPEPEKFHPTDEDTLAAARSLCDACPSKGLCLALGLARDEWGVWGGVLLEGGKPLDKPRQPGRPKKAAAA